MDTTTHQQTATIYDFADFAARQRVNRLRGSHADRAVEFPADLPKATFGGAWYHEEAIQGSSDTKHH